MAGARAADDVVTGEQRHHAAMSCSSRDDPRTRTLRPSGVMTNESPRMAINPSAVNLSTANLLMIEGFAAGARNAFNTSHWLDVSSQSNSSFMAYWTLGLLVAGDSERL